ncbi:MAG: bifunctional DNA primase/polymerase [Myxococcota bacterium]
MIDPAPLIDLMRSLHPETAPGAAAKAYARLGHVVFPVRGRDKRPLVRWGTQATDDRRVLDGWWSQWPDAMIGLPTGERNGVLVLDVDCRRGGCGLTALRGLGFDPVASTPLCVQTPSEGFHFYFRYDHPLRNSSGVIAPNVDVRGDGGFVVVPPSRPERSRSPYRVVPRVDSPALAATA